MGKSYPDRYNSSGVWKINEISKNRQTNKNFPEDILVWFKWVGKLLLM